MEAEARSSRATGTQEVTPEQDALAKAAGAWVQQFARTLKNCRLYDARNPAVLRFREQLSAALTRLLDEQGNVSLRFASDDVLCEGVSIHPAKSREDNLALPFYRDGVRAITFLPGMEQRELDAFLDAVLVATGQHDAEDDLVTLLWQAQLRHLDVDFVPAEGDLGTAATEGDPAPWPSPSLEPEAQEAVSVAEGTGVESRSDDWNVGEVPDEIEAGYAEIEAIAEREGERFRREYALEHAEPPVLTAIAIVKAFIAAEAEPHDLVELGRFLPRVLRIAIEDGHWREARQSIVLLRAHAAAEWPLDTFVQELQQPVSVAAMKSVLEQQDPEATADFVALAGELGDPGVDLLSLVLADVEAPRQQRILSDAIVGACRANPERLAPWLSDPRPLVVRSAVQMLGAIGGDAIAGVLQAVVAHEDVRVRLELLLALKTVTPAVAHALLLRLAQDADARVFRTALQQLSQARDPGVARLVLGLMLAPSFERRPEEERRAIYSALGATGGDEVVPELEAELLKGGWFAHGDEGHRQAVARCLWHVGTPQARIALENGARSKRSPVKALCEQMLARWEQRG